MGADLRGGWSVGEVGTRGSQDRGHRLLDTSRPEIIRSSQFLDKPSELANFFLLSIRSDSEKRIRQPVVGDGKVP